MILFKGKKGKFLLIAGLTLISIFILCSLGFASEGGGHGGTDGSQRLWDLGARFLNFAILVIILFVVIKKTDIKDFFSGRRAEISQKFEDLKKERDAAESRFRKLEEKLKAFETKKKEIIQQFEAEGVAEKEKIIAEAEERAKQIREQAGLTIQREIQAAKDRLATEMVEAAAQRAQGIIEKKITDRDQDQLVNEFIERVEKLH